MKTTEKIEKMIESLTNDDDFILIEESELRKVIRDLEKTMLEIEKKKNISANILIDFKNLEKRIKSIINNKPLMVKESLISEKIYGFGENGAIEVHGDMIVITKKGKSVEITKNEFVDILKKIGKVK